MLLVGAGPMAKCYAEVLSYLHIEFTVVCRSETSLRDFKKSYDVEGFSGGLLNYIRQGSRHDTAIVAVNTTELASCTKELIRAGYKKILVEKPGALSSKELQQVAELSHSRCDVFIAYNRRFLPSVVTLQSKLNSANQLVSCHFDFTERTKIISNLDKPLSELNRWVIANSSHIIDLSYFLIGLPREGFVSNVKQGSLKWHNASIFTGCGTSSKKVPFTYHSNWQSAGRWSVEIMTDSGKYLLCPIEKLLFCEYGKFEFEDLDLIGTEPRGIKPGLYNMMNAFLCNDRNLPTIFEQQKLIETCESMAGYK